MPNVVYLETESKSRPELRAFLWLLAAGAAGTFCAFLPTARFLLPV
jgi:hypothetical protein